MINIRWWCVNQEEIWDASIQEPLITGHFIGGGGSFIPMKARLPGYENTWIIDRAGLVLPLPKFPFQILLAQIMAVK